MKKRNITKKMRFNFSSGLQNQSVFFQSCPWGTLILSMAFIAIGYALVVNWENGMYLEYTKMQRSLATLKAEQNNYRLNIAKRHVLDPQIIEMTWDESKRIVPENLVLENKKVNNVVSSR